MKTKKQIISNLCRIEELALYMALILGVILFLALVTLAVKPASPVKIYVLENNEITVTN